MKKKSKLIYVISLLTLLSPLMAFAARPLALIWDGPGACKPNCVFGATRVALDAGFKVKYVNPRTKNFSIFSKAKLWIQPGGHSKTAHRSMSNDLLDNIKSFISKGGGYVGFCAGMFISTPKIGTTGDEGYGIIPGETELLLKDSDSERAMLKVSTTKYGDRWMYYAGGPFLKITDEDLASVQGEVTARYPDGSIAGIHGHYGKGKVSVVGFHPEAGKIWKKMVGKVDKDGNDIFFAVDMIRYATSP